MPSYSNGRYQKGRTNIQQQNDQSKYSKDELRTKRFREKKDNTGLSNIQAPTGRLRKATTDRTPTRASYKEEYDLFDFDAYKEIIHLIDRNIDKIRDYFGVDVIESGKNDYKVTFEGADKVKVKQIISFFEECRKSYANDEAITLREVGQFIEVLKNDKTIDPVKLFESKIILKGGAIKNIIPKTKNQVEYIKKIESSDVTFGIGPAGTGKTYLAVAKAVSMLLNREVKKIIIARPAVEAGENLGFLPGDLKEKVDPYLRPIYDALYDMLGEKTAEQYLDNKTIEICPIAYMRGRTLTDAFIILDEAQNATLPQLKMVLTRFGGGSKMVVTGDPTQSDLGKNKSGLLQCVNILSNLEQEGISIPSLDYIDIIRHRVVAVITDAFEKAEKNETKNAEKNEKSVYGNNISVSLDGASFGEALKNYRNAIY